MVIALGEVYSGVFSVSTVYILEEMCDVGAVYLVTTPSVLTEGIIHGLDSELQFYIHSLVRLAGLERMTHLSRQPRILMAASSMSGLDRAYRSTW